VYPALELELCACGAALATSVPLTTLVTMASLETAVATGISQSKLQVMQGMGTSRAELDVGAGAKGGMSLKLSVGLER
jgi:hypothetical protein